MESCGVYCCCCCCWGCDGGVGCEDEDDMVIAVNGGMA